jgi:hypothetical protein
MMLSYQFLITTPAAVSSQQTQDWREAMQPEAEKSFSSQQRFAV